MIKRLLLALLIILSLPVFAEAQSGYSRITAVVQDTNNSLYVNAPYSITFVDPGTSGKLPLINGSTFQQFYTGINTDSFGNFTATLPDNDLICSTSGECGTQWKISICSIKYGNTTYCFNVTVTVNSTDPNPNDITSTIEAAAAILPVTGSVTSFSVAAAPNCLLPLFTCVVSSPTVHPSLAFTLVNKAANLFYAGPCTGGAIAPTFRALCANDFPAGIIGNSSLTNSSLTINGVSCTLGGSCSLPSGSVSSVNIAVPSWLTVTGCPITTSGTCTIAPNTGQTPHLVIGTCGSATTFSPCALTPADVSVPPAISTFCAANISNNVTLNGSPVAISSCTVATPSSGCPCRVEFSWATTILKNSAGTGVVEWVSGNVADSLTNVIWGVAGAGESNASSGGRAEVGNTSKTEGTYSNSTTIIFTLNAQNGSGNYSLFSVPFTGPITTTATFQVSVLTSN